MIPNALLRPTWFVMMCILVHDKNKKVGDFKTKPKILIKPFLFYFEIISFLNFWVWECHYFSKNAADFVKYLNPLK